MMNNYAYTPHIWLSFIMVPLLLTLSDYSWRRRNVPAALPPGNYEHDAVWLDEI